VKQNNTIRNNTFYNSTYGVYIPTANSSYNLFFYNNFTSSSSLHALSGSSIVNYWNTTVGGVARGNYWDDISSLKITDSNSDGYGDGGSQYPYNNTNGGKVSAGVNDWGPKMP
jgi:parallel beta-helix repeat protein